MRCIIIQNEFILKMLVLYLHKISSDKFLNKTFAVCKLEFKNHPISIFLLVHDFSSFFQMQLWIDAAFFTDAISFINYKTRILWPKFSNFTQNFVISPVVTHLFKE